MHIGFSSSSLILPSQTPPYPTFKTCPTFGRQVSHKPMILEWEDGQQIVPFFTHTVFMLCISDITSCKLLFLKSLKEMTLFIANKRENGIEFFKNAYVLKEITTFQKKDLFQCSSALRLYRSYQEWRKKLIEWRPMSQSKWGWWLVCWN